MMNDRSQNSFKKITCLLCLFISACGSVASPTPNKAGSPTFLPTVTSSVATMTETSPQETEQNAAVVITHTPLPQTGDYIIYSKHNQISDLEEVWAIDPNNLNSFALVDNIIPRDWSPSNNSWLFTKNGTIYLANADGSNLQILFRNEEYNGIDPFWLTDNIILFNAYRDNFSPPDIYSLDIHSGILTQLFPGLNQFIQTTFPSEQTWLRGDWSTGSLDLINQNGKIEKFFDNFTILADYFNPYQIQWISRIDQYLIIAKGPNDSNYKFWLVSSHKTKTVIFDPGNNGVNFFRVSPNEQYLGLTYVTSKGTFINIISLETRELVYKWPCPYEIGSCEFVWSPDSEMLALPYSDSSVGNSNGITSGIQTMNIKTGETRRIVKENATRIISWHSLQ